MPSQIFENRTSRGQKLVDQNLQVDPNTGPTNPHTQSKMQPAQPIHVEHAPNAGSVD